MDNFQMDGAQMATAAIVCIGTLVLALFTVRNKRFAPVTPGEEALKRFVCGRFPRARFYRDGDLVISRPNSLTYEYDTRTDRGGVWDASGIRVSVLLYDANAEEIEEQESILI